VVVSHTVLSACSEFSFLYVGHLERSLSVTGPVPNSSSASPRTHQKANTLKLPPHPLMSHSACLTLSHSQIWPVPGARSEWPPGPSHWLGSSTQQPPAMPPPAAAAWRPASLLPIPCLDKECLAAKAHGAEGGKGNHIRPTPAAEPPWEPEPRSQR
jgi:hypothetical protein